MLQLTFLDGTLPIHLNTSHAPACYIRQRSLIQPTISCYTLATPPACYTTMTSRYSSHLLHYHDTPDEAGPIQFDTQPPAGVRLDQPLPVYAFSATPRCIPEAPCIPTIVIRR